MEDSLIFMETEGAIWRLGGHAFYRTMSAVHVGNACQK